MSADELGGGDDEVIRAAASRWWSALRHGDDEVTRAAYARWRDEDPRHAIVFDRMARRWDQSAFLTNTPLGRDRDLGRVAARRRSPFLWPAIAAGALGVVAVGYHLRDARVDGATRDVRLAFATADHARKRIRLADGSTIILGSGSSLRVAFVRDQRRLQLVEGRARFDVAHDPLRPFTVSSANGSVTARGTRFDVDVRRTTMQVTLLRGVVDVRGSADRDHPRTLRPGETVTVERDRPVPAARRVAGVMDRPAMIVLDRVPLRTAAERVGGVRAVLLTVDAALDGDMRITGAFRGGDVDGLASAAAAMFDLRLLRGPDGSLRLQPR